MGNVTAFNPVPLPVTQYQALDIRFALHWGFIVLGIVTLLIGLYKIGMTKRRRRGEFKKKGKRDIYAKTK